MNRKLAWYMQPAQRSTITGRIVLPLRFVLRVTFTRTSYEAGWIEQMQNGAWIVCEYSDYQIRTIENFQTARDAKMHLAERYS